MRRNNREKPRSIPPESAAASTINLVALQLLTENDAPIGNNRLVQALEEAGIAVAEATAGRALSKLVSQGLARTLGKRGRVVTPAGREKLASLQREMMRRQRSARLVDVANIGNVESLRDMLIVRRAIEPEAARLAASRASAEDIALLDKYACAHCTAPMENSQRVDPAVSFHCQLVRASHHDFLIELGLLTLEQNDTFLLDKISHDPRLARQTAKATKRDANAFAKDHELIVDAIKRRDPDAAERTMRRHIDRLLVKATAYRSSLEPKAW